MPCTCWPDRCILISSHYPADGHDALAEYRSLKVAKILHFLATFLIHPCTFMSHLDLIVWTADQLGKPI